MNNIHKENEIFAKRTIKVPARPLSSILAGVHSSGSNSPQEKTGNPLKDTDAEVLNLKLNDRFTSFGTPGKNGSMEVNRVIFNSSLKPWDISCDNAVNGDVANTPDNEYARLLPRVSIPNTEAIVHRMSFDGADADISWKALIVCVVVLIFAVPLIYVFYIAEHLAEYHSQTS